MLVGTLPCTRRDALAHRGAASPILSFFVLPSVCSICFCCFPLRVVRARVRVCVRARERRKRTGTHCTLCIFRFVFSFLFRLPVPLLNHARQRSLCLLASHDVRAAAPALGEQ